MRNTQYSILNAPSATVSVGEAILWGQSALAHNGSDARLEAELLLAHALGMNRAQLLARLRESLAAAPWSAYAALLERRTAHEPLAYIVGHKEFYGLDLDVDRRVLIPRPETELLVAQALKTAGWLRGYNYRFEADYMNCASCPVPGDLAIADVGTGCGAIAIALAKHLPATYTLYASDISADALAVAAQNCERHNVATRVRLLQGNLLDPIPGRVDLVVANLPYVARREWHTLARDIADHEPRLALDGGEDGLDLIRAFLAQAPDRLSDSGAVLLEIGATQGAAVAALARQHFPRASIEIVKDEAHLPRVVIIRNASLAGQS